MNTITPQIPAGAVTHQGEPRWHVGQLFEFLVTAEQTGGAFSLMRATCRPGFDPPRHVHAHEDELFCVLDGEVTFALGDRELAAGPGSTAWLPRGVPHAFRIESDLATMLLLLTPGAGETLFREFSVPAARRELPPLGEHLPDPAEMGARMAQLGIDVVGPPLPTRA